MLENNEFIILICSYFLKICMFNGIAGEYVKEIINT